MTDFAQRLERTLEETYQECPDNASARSILLLVLDAVSEARTIAPPVPTAPERHANLAETLKAARRQRNLTVRQVSELTGVSIGKISRLENACEFDTSLTTARALTKLYGLAPEVWFR